MSVRFLWNGRPVEARPGDSIAAALTEAGERQLGADRAGRERSLFCGMGVCQECLVTIDGVPSRQACMTVVAPGMDVRRQDDAAVVPPVLPEPRPRIADATSDLAIVGGGPAGLNAALAAAAAGLSVLVIDERGETGGQYYKPRTSGYRGDAPPDAQHRRGSALRAKAEAAGIALRLGETVWFARRETDGRFDIRTSGPRGIARILARALIIATGAYEMPTAVPGWTLPGVMTIGAAQTLVRKYGTAPRGRILIAGHGPLGLQLAAEITRIGGTVAAVAERATLADPLALARATFADPRLVADGVACAASLIRHGAPLLRGWELVAVEGETQAEAAVLRRIKDGARRRIAADTICIGEGFAPQTELARLLDVPMTLDPRGIAVPERDQTGATDIDGVWIIGDAGGLGGARLAEAQGLLAGAAAAARLGRTPVAAHGATERLNKAAAFQKQLWRLYDAPPRATPEDETVICRCEGVHASDVREAIAAGARDPGAIKRATRLGMGRCQGRYCLATAMRLLAEAGEPVSADMLFAPQLPAKPVPVAALADEKAEWSGHRESHPGARPSAPRNEPLGTARADLAIIGAGITGLSAALFAARQGARVVVLDRGRIAAEASGGNAGSLHLQLLSWDFGGKAVGGGDLQLRTLPLQQESIALWGALEAELGADFEMAVTGGLMVAESHDQIRFLEAKAAAEARVGITTEVIDARRIRAIAPAISERMVAAAWCPGEGKINPLAASNAVANAARAAGVIIEELTPATGLMAEGDGYRITTPRGALLADRVIIAAGGWSAAFGAMLGAPIPVRGAPLQMVVTEPTAPILPCLVAHADRHLTMKQTADSTILIGGAWTARTSAAGQPLVLPESLEGNVWVAARTVPAVSGLRVVRSWAAMNIDIDGAPLIGALPGHPRVTVAATANGFTLGPLMGREAAHLALGGTARDGLEAFGFGRFGA
ncbi:MAG: FAD-dependent oxidoreductase [Rhizobiales bacterium]|nr:FAD-dependent oxidoreductase [Hyphomicrobiales bacterium]